MVCSDDFSRQFPVRFDVLILETRMAMISLPSFMIDSRREEAFV